MRAAKKTTVNKKLLQEFVPLNALSPERFNEVSEKIIIEEVLAGRFLFRKGDKDNQSIYLLEGKINLIDGFRKVTGEIESGTDMSRYAISNQQPRPLSARAARKSIIARIDSGLLDVFLTWDQSSSAEVVEIGANDDQDWMTRILQTAAFIKIPPAMIQSLLIKMQSFPVKDGDVVIRQGDPGDYFYTVHEGRCAVTRKDSPEAKDQWLAELGEGTSFGEDALVSDAVRNATVTMLTDGLLMRLAKDDFVELLKKQLVTRVDYDRAATMVDEGAVWIDVRTVDEYDNGSFEDSVNMPLSNLREELSELVFNTKYIICCDTGRRSESAGFLLSHKGFDVYVLEGGIPATAADPGPAAVQVSNEPAVVESEATPVSQIASEQADAGESCADREDMSAAALDQELASLHAENGVLQAEIQKYQSGEVRMAEQVEQLRGELGESGDKLGTLYAKEKAAAEQFEQLRAELGESGEKLGTLYAQLKSDSDAMQLLQEQYAALQQQHIDAVNTRQLDNEDLARQLSEMQARVEADREHRSVLEQDAASGQAAQQDIQQLQDELNKAGERILALESDVIKSDEAGSELLSSVESRLQEQLDLVEHLRAEMAAAGQLTAGFQDEARTFAAEHEATRAEFQEKLLQQTALSEKLQAELDGLKREITETSGKLGEQSGHATALEEENADLLKQLEALKSEAATGKQELETVLTAEKQQQSELQQQLADLQAVLEQQQRALSDASTENETASGAAQSLEQDNEKLRTELRETARLLDEQKECVANQLAAMQAGEEALQKQQAGWGAERTALQQEVAQEQQLIEELRQELDQIKAQTEENRADLEKEQQALLDKAKEQLERLEVENAGHRNAQSSHDEQLELAAMEREQLQQTLNAVNEGKSTLESEIESLKEQASSLAAGSEEALQLLQGQLDTERSRLAGLEQDGGDKDSQIRDLQQEILQSGESRNAVKQELEALRQQHEDSRSQFEQQADRIKELEQEHNASIQKAHEDLTRKNDNEKELQGQINRLRKKLEQTSADQKSTRDGSQADLDNIREELHAERKARAEERAEMAARQRELKEQLMAIALEHEANLSNRSGAIEQARDAGREEEQERLRNLIEAQSQSEEQMFALQSELQKAHEELAELGRQEKDRRQVDMDMMQEQNQQAVSTITQLESQLKQLTLDRDAALEEQQVIREKMNALRGEVEVARGLMNAGSQGQVEDPEKLRHELSESKKNMAIALRLRAEAEAARDQLIEERNKLRQELGEEATQSAPVQVRTLAADKAGNDGSSRQPKAAMVSIPENKAKPEGREKAARQPAVAGVGRGGSQRRWLGAAIGLGVVTAVALAAWLFIGVESPLSGVIEVLGVPDVADVKGQNSGDEKPLAPAIPVVATSKPAKPVSPLDEVRESVAVITPPRPVVTEVVAEAPAKEVVPEPRPQQASATRSFQDSLKGGLKGPLMVELPASEYLMGSPGNSLNFDEGPRHNVTLPVFSISKNEITFADYDKFARSTGRRMPYDESWGRGDRPVINVSWNDAQAYTSWLSKKTGKHYRLPTEAEWEYAARAGSDGKAWWDSDADVKQANCFNCGNEWAGQRTVPAGTFKANGFGLNDTAGNVQEWTEDCYRAGYAGAPVDGSAWLTPGCTQRSVRGGSYTNPLDSLRNGKRSQYDQDTRLDNLGFRVVRSN